MCQNIMILILNPVFKLWENQQALPFNAAWVDPSSLHLLKSCTVWVRLTNQN